MHSPVVLVAEGSAREGLAQRKPWGLAPSAANCLVGAGHAQVHPVMQAFTWEVGANVRHHPPPTIIK